MFSLIFTRINGWVNNGEAGDLRRYLVHCEVIVMLIVNCTLIAVTLSEIPIKYKLFIYDNAFENAAVK